MSLAKRGSQGSIVSFSLGNKILAAGSDDPPSETDVESGIVVSKSASRTSSCNSINKSGKGKGIIIASTSTPTTNGTPRKESREIVDGFGSINGPEKPTENGMTNGRDESESYSMSIVNGESLIAPLAEPVDDTIDPSSMNVNGASGNRRIPSKPLLHSGSSASMSTPGQSQNVEVLTRSSSVSAVKTTVDCEMSGLNTASATTALTEADGGITRSTSESIRGTSICQSASSLSGATTATPAATETVWNGTTATTVMLAGTTTTSPPAPVTTNTTTGNSTMMNGSRRDSEKSNEDDDFVFLMRNGDLYYEKKNDEERAKHDKDLAEKKKNQIAQLRESLFLILSGLYGIIIIILGAVIPITEIFISDTIDRTFEAFYVFLYLTSIIFLIYVYAYLLRRNRLKTEFLTRTLSRSLSWTKAWAKSWAKADEGSKSKLRKRMISLDVSNHHTGTFYLRLGVLGFGIGSMIHSGLNFGAFFSVSDSDCNDALRAIKPLLHLGFTFFQLYFIFMNSKMCIHRYKKLARFGLMHMCATNICVWFRSIVVETLHVIHMHAHASHHDDGHHGDGHGTATDHGSSHGSHDDHQSHHAGGGYDVVNSTLMKVGRKLHGAVQDNGNLSGNADACQWSDMMGKAVEAAGPYLYPCTIEYSLMCAGILYIMWKNVGNRPRRPRESELEDDEEDDHQRMHRMSVDCTSSSRGLFLGILLMVGTIISIIAFYMLVNQDGSQDSAIILTHLSETAVYLVTLVALIFATWRMKSLTFHNEHGADLEDILILISYTGLLAFIIFSLVASILHTADTRSALTILSNVIMLIQATVQTIFMLAGDRMTASNDFQQRKKPGREFITFLLISNFAMWAINTFETQTQQHNPIQVEFYGPEAWAIFTHISVPLGIYYRFHSTVCFSNIWKNAWKIRKHI